MTALVWKDGNPYAVTRHADGVEVRPLTACALVLTEGHVARVLVFPWASRREER